MDPICHNKDWNISNWAQICKLGNERNRETAEKGLQKVLNNNNAPDQERTQEKL